VSYDIHCNQSKRFDEREGEGGNPHSRQTARRGRGKEKGGRDVGNLLNLPFCPHERVQKKKKGKEGKKKGSFRPRFQGGEKGSKEFTL